MKTFTRSQLVNFLSLTVAALIVVGVSVMYAYKIPVSAPLASLSVACCAYVCSQCRALNTANAGLIKGVAYSHLTPTEQNVMDQTMAQIIAGRALADAQAANVPAPTVTLTPAPLGVSEAIDPNKTIKLAQDAILKGIAEIGVQKAGELLSGLMLKDVPPAAQDTATPRQTPPVDAATVAVGETLPPLEDAPQVEDLPDTETDAAPKTVEVSQNIAPQNGDINGPSLVGTGSSLAG